MDAPISNRTDRSVHLAGEIESGTTYCPPVNQREEQLVLIWQQVLGKDRADMERIGIDDDFFDLGGHSLKATILVAKIQREFSVKITLTEIFKKQNIQSISIVRMEVPCCSGTLSIVEKALKKSKKNIKET